MIYSQDLRQINMATTGLERFLKAQETDFHTALNEITNGRKRTHWMWYIFPQIKGLGFSDIANFYAIGDLNEAGTYLNHRVLGPRLVLITAETLKLENRTAYQIFGSPDNLKFHSCMTLFATVPGADPVFQQALNRYFNGLKDSKTLQILGLQNFK